MSSKSKPPAGSQRPMAKPKTMSSKLLTMKFMQRASSTSRHDTLAVREALKQENAKRDAALQARERIASIASPGDAETRWELSYVKKIDTGHGGSAKVVDWGYQELVNNREEGEEEEDSDSDSENDIVGGGRMVFGQFKRKGELSKPDSEDKDSESDPDSDDTPGPDKKKKSEFMLLRGLTSISNAGPPQTIQCRGCNKSGHTQANCPNAMCFACDGKGHMSRDCPNGGRRAKKREPVGGLRDETKRRRLGHY